jgi:hypothetical protein
MAKKGKAGAKGKKKAGPVGPNGETLLENYRKACKLIGVEPSMPFLQSLDAILAETPTITQLCVADQPLGPAGVRCIAAGLMGELPGMEGGLYLNLTNLHIWRCGAKDDGVAAIAKLIHNQEKEFQLGVLDLLDNDVGLRGCEALGRSLAAGGNQSLLTLSLNANRLDAKCVGALAEGLRTNGTLRKLSLE